MALIELPAAVFDLGPLRDWGFNEGPTGLAGQSLLTSLACAAADLDDGATSDAVLAAATEKAIRAGDLDHSYDDADPDGHYDNTWLGHRYRTDGLVLQQLQELSAQPDATAAVRTLRSEDIRAVALPFLGTGRTELLLVDGLSGAFELPAVGVAASLPALLTSIADQLGIAHEEIAVVAGTPWMARAAIQAGLATVWVDRHGRIRSSTYQDGVSRSYRWSGGQPVPAIADDLAAAVQLLLSAEATD